MFFTIFQLQDQSAAKLASLSPAQIDEGLKKILKDPEANFHYDGITHQNMVNLPIYQRKALAQETRQITKDAGAFLYHK